MGHFWAGKKYFCVHVIFKLIVGSKFFHRKFNEVYKLK